MKNDAAPHSSRNEEKLLKSLVRKNLAIGLVITVVITTLSVVMADDGSKMEEFKMSLMVGLLVTGTVTGGTWLLQRRRSAP
ncbi:heme/copper-type cytochrome/quinol oxidase subunit 4 [Streptomyces sp. B3I7]|uniref:hypothetical protein n=1 Tax=Streptomyces sp. B3I7 TaxID=3042269 RepID=UPI002785C086|nr:hypothetical protein [Streptomyces sp. B3I7]MDQ0808702.1 heme/copper-type cytochrome/quinol oxidase subunit 4 [Streptomyces sp. B3I7]